MKRREIVLSAIAVALALSIRVGDLSYAETPPACQPPDTTGLDARLPCTVPLEVEVNDRNVTLRWYTAEVESILGDKFEGYRVWRWRVPRGYNERDPFSPEILLPDTSSYSLLQVIAKRDTSAQFYPFSFDSVGGEWAFSDPGDLFTFTKAASLFIPPGGGVGDSVFFFTTIPREEDGPINGFPYYYAVTYFGDIIDTLFTTATDTAFITVGLSSKMPDPLTDFVFPVFAGGRPKDNLGEVIAIPNPYSDRASWEFFGRRKMQFVNLPDRSRVDVYTAAGDFIRTLHLDAGRGGAGEVNTLDWDLRNEAGEEVTAGIYIFRVEAPNGRESIGRFVVIR